MGAESAISSGEVPIVESSIISPTPIVLLAMERCVPPGGSSAAKCDILGISRTQRNDRIAPGREANSSYSAAASDGEDLNEHQTGDETTNVCCIRNAACLHAAEEAEALD